MNIYKTLETIITSANPSEKFELFRTFYAQYQAGKINFKEISCIRRKRKYSF